MLRRLVPATLLFQTVLLLPFMEAAAQAVQTTSTEFTNTRHPLFPWEPQYIGTSQRERPSPLYSGAELGMLTKTEKPEEGRLAGESARATNRHLSSSEVVSVVAAPELILSGENAVTAKASLIEASAGTFGDPSRFLQLQAGVEAGNDERNDILVRGGNASETAFVIDGIPVPNINHLALSDTTGGFVSMIDNEAINSLTLHSGVHDAHFADRLSSIVEISTVPSSGSDQDHDIHRSVEAGISGVGYVTSRPLSPSGELKGSMLMAFRQSVLNLMTTDIGMNGVPTYTNTILRSDKALTDRDRIWGMSLTGLDSMSIHPSATDVLETNPFDINYQGWRNTSGLNWQHDVSASTFTVVTVSNAEQAQSIQQYDQLLNQQKTYDERTHEGISQLSAAITRQTLPGLILSAGLDGTSSRINYKISQPVTLPNPYSASEESSGATAVATQFTTQSVAPWVQATVTLPYKIHVAAGLRSSFWSFGANSAVTPRIILSLPVHRHSISFGWAQYAQMPSFLYLLAFQENHQLTPIRARHVTTDAQLITTAHLHLFASAYEKVYSSYPVALPYPQLSMANISDTFGQSFLMFPMVSRGVGRAAGVELSLEEQIGRRVLVSANAAYSRVWYAGLDRILRRADIDIPFVGNVSSIVQLVKNMSIALRYSGSSGRPYTPDDLNESVEQNRDVYDLDCLNCRRAPAYGRLDFRLEGKAHLRRGCLAWNVGLLNALNRKNFYAFQWQPRLANFGLTGSDAVQTQLPRFPEGSLKYSF